MLPATGLSPVAAGNAATGRLGKAGGIKDQRLTHSQKIPRQIRENVRGIPGLALSGGRYEHHE